MLLIPNDLVEELEVQKGKFGLESGILMKDMTVVLEFYFFGYILGNKKGFEEKVDVGLEYV